MFNTSHDRVIDGSVEKGANVLDEILTKKKLSSMSDSTILDAYGLQNESWPQLIDLDQINLPEWPKNALPDFLNGFVYALAKSTETDPTMSAMMMLAALGTAAQGKFIVRVKSDYEEELCLWTCCAMEPGTRKTAVLNSVIKPLSDWEYEYKIKTDSERKRVESEIKIQNEIISSKRRQLGQAKDSKDLQFIKQEIIELEEKIPMPITEKRLWVNDVTTERLAVLMSENDERMGILSDEGGLFDTMNGRYSNGVANIDLYLKAHCGSAAKVERQSRTPIDLRRPLISFGIVVQPDVIKGLSNKKEFRGRGLIARFLFGLPKSNVGYRTNQTEPMCEKIKNDYHCVIRDMLNFNANNNGRPLVIILSNESLHLWKNYSDEIEAEMQDGKSLRFIRDWAGKFPGEMLRIAGLLHVAHCDLPPISSTQPS